jgi:hypothetical protein
VLETTVFPKFGYMLFTSLNPNAELKPRISNPFPLDGTPANLKGLNFLY